jgi:hypothetical protein
LEEEDKPVVTRFYRPVVTRQRALPAVAGEGGLREGRRDTRRRRWEARLRRRHN